MILAISKVPEMQRAKIGVEWGEKKGVYLPTASPLPTHQELLLSGQEGRSSKLNLRLML